MRWKFFFALMFYIFSVSYATDNELIDEKPNFCEGCLKFFLNEKRSAILFAIAGGGLCYLCTGDLLPAFLEGLMEINPVYANNFIDYLENSDDRLFDFIYTLISQGILRPGISLVAALNSVGIGVIVHLMVECFIGKKYMKPVDPD